MKILVINGSPRGKRSNTLKIASAFVEGAAKTGDGVEILDIETLGVKSCRGCFSCWGVTPGQCVVHDGMDALREDVYNKAELLVWSFPFYVYGLPGKLKCFIDRLLPNKYPEIYEDEMGRPYHPERYDRSRQRHVVVSSCGFFTTEDIYDSVSALFRLFLQDKFKETIYCAQGELMNDEGAGPLTGPFLACVKKAGEEFAACGRIGEAARQKLRTPLLDKGEYMKTCNAHWQETAQKRGDVK